MKRNKLLYLMEIKRLKYSHLKRKQPYVLNHTYAQWEENYYGKKQTLNQILSTNNKIIQLLNAYGSNPSAFNLQMLEKLIDRNCQRINHCDRTLNAQLNSVNQSSLMTQTMRQISQNVNKNFRNILYSEIKKLFQAKASIAQIIEKSEAKEKVFNAFSNSQNISYTSLNNRSIFPEEDRLQTFDEVSSKIQQLGLILRRMNVLVSEQGQLVNQIDENMKKGTKNMVQGREILQKRAQREEGTDDSQFSLSGRINKLIGLMYVINIILIVVWVLKNLS